MQTNKIPVACLAPALSDEKIAAYHAIIAGLPVSPIKDAMASCLAAVKAWWALPESTRRGDRYETTHQGKAKSFDVTPLESEHVKTLHDHVPWMYELEAMKLIFEAIPNDTQKELRDAAHHLLWHAIELCNDHEPTTQDKLK